MSETMAVSTKDLQGMTFEELLEELVKTVEQLVETFKDD